MKLSSLLKTLFRRRGFEKGMDQEMRFHLESYTEDLVKSGVSRAEAERRARIEFGGVELTQEQCRQAKGVQRFDELRQDASYAVRTLRKNPGFALVAIVTIALGVGTNSAVFSVVNSVILKPLPFKDPQRVMHIGEVNPTRGSEVPLFSPANFIDLQEQQQSFESVATYFFDTVKYSNNGSIENWPAFDVTGGFFTALGVDPILGRVINRNDVESDGTRAVVISFHLWKDKFGGDPQIIGKTLVLSKEPYLVIGVMPEHFRAPTSGNYADLWIALSTKYGQFQDRADRYTNVIGRLKPGMSVAQAQSEMNVLATRFAEKYPKTNKGWQIVVDDLGQYITGDVRLPLLIMFAAGFCVLLVACANVANLLLARASARKRELGIRSALGASRARLIRQVVTESLILTLSGGALGTAFSFWSINAVREFKPVHLPRVDELAVDVRVLLFALGVSIVAGCLCGAISGWLSTRNEIAGVLKDGGAQTSGGSRAVHVRNLLIVAELSLSLVLLVSAGLLTRSFYKLTHDNPGFDSQNIFTASISGGARATADKIIFYQRFVERVQKIPGVESAALATAPPLTANTISFPLSVKGETRDDGEKVRTALDSITPGYFATMRIPIKTGRDVSEMDRLDTARVGLVNEAFARRYLGGIEHAVGRELDIVYLGTPITAEIVGVVGDTKRDSLSEKMQPSVYLPESQVPWFGATVVVKTKSDPREYAKPVLQALHEFAPEQDLFAPQSMDEAISKIAAQPKFYSVLLSAFAIIAVLLACVGLYGVISYVTSQRTQEIGIRMALGAGKGNILGMILSQGMALVGIGLALGLAGAFAATRFLSTLLYNVSTTDTLSYLSVSFLLAAVALFACYIPARRATKADPLVALRYN